jgi:hypothetical protein
MPSPISLCSKMPKGLAFEIADHILIRGWADFHDLLPVVRIDHGVEGEEYEEAIAFHIGINPLCQLIIWRNEDAVFVQPLIGRMQRYNTVCEALEGLLLTKCVLLTDITATAWSRFDNILRTNSK